MNALIWCPLIYFFLWFEKKFMSAALFVLEPCILGPDENQELFYVALWEETHQHRSSTVCSKLQLLTIFFKKIRCDPRCLITFCNYSKCPFLKTPVPKCLHVIAANYLSTGLSTHFFKKNPMECSVFQFQWVIAYTLPYYGFFICSKPQKKH